MNLEMQSLPNFYYTLNITEALKIYKLRKLRTITKISKLGGSAT